MRKESRIAERRKFAGYSQKELAKMMGVAQNTISNWEQGRREPDNKALKKLSVLLGCSVDYLIGASDYLGAVQVGPDSQSDTDTANMNKDKMTEFMSAMIENRELLKRFLSVVAATEPEMLAQLFAKALENEDGISNTENKT